MNDSTSEQQPVTLSLQVHGALVDLLPRPFTGQERITHTIHRKASVKDVIESLGIPHPIVGELLVNGQEVPFSYILVDGDRVEVVGLTPPVDVLTPSVLRPVPLAAVRFVTDVNVGKLAAFLRMAGFDTRYHNHLHDAELAELAHAEQRILLTKDTNLLKRKKVEFGHLVRAVKPPLQLAEVVRLFGLEGELHPFSRCMQCNGELAPVAKEEIVHRLEPLTKKYYHSFHRCSGCNKIYWPGSHKERMLGYLDFAK